jgi:hypothetical protein
MSALLTGCTITRSVEPIAKLELPTVLCIQENDTVWSKEFLPWLDGEFRRHGFETKVYVGSPPEECHLTATYAASWGWDMAVYLKHANIRLFEDGKPIGSVVYDATEGSANMKKFGRTENKLRPMIDEMLDGAKISARPRSTPDAEQ